MYFSFVERHVTTRKPHRCEWCNETIETGSEAFYRAYKIDDDFLCGWQHPECEQAMRRTEEVLDEWLPGDFPRGGSTRKDEQR